MLGLREEVVSFDWASEFAEASAGAGGEKSRKVN
jgi:hypothetical protein